MTKTEKGSPTVSRLRSFPSRNFLLFRASVLPIWLMIRIRRDDSRLAKSFRLPSFFPPSLGRRRARPPPRGGLQLSNLVKCLEAIWRWIRLLEVKRRQCSRGDHLHQRRQISLRCVQCPRFDCEMRPAKLILSLVCVALLAAELGSAEASPPYEEVVEDARVQERVRDQICVILICFNLA